MIRRIVITALNILLTGAMVLHAVLRYGRIMTSAPDEIAILEAVINWLPLIVVVNLANGVWKRIEQKKQLRPYLITVANVLLLLWIGVACFLPDSSKSICYSVIALLLINAVNVYYIRTKQKADEAPDPVTEE